MVNRSVVLPLNHYDLRSMCLQNDHIAYVWVYSRSASRSMPDRAKAPEHRNVSARVNGLRDGTYRVEVWDTYKGVVVATRKLPAANGSLTVALPTFRIDCVLKIKPAS